MVRVRFGWPATLMKPLWPGLPRPGKSNARPWKAGPQGNGRLGISTCPLCVLAVLLAVVPGRSDDPPKAAEKIDLDELVPHPDLDWLRRAKAPTDDAGLVRFLDGLRGKEADPAEVEQLVRTLAAGTKDEAAAADKALREIGAVAVPVLRRYRLEADAAGAARVRACLEAIDEAADRPLARPAMRRLVMRKAPGAADALLGYVPFAFDPAAAEDAWYGLDELAAKDPKTLATLAAALSDKQPARRAVAACILGRRGDATQKAAVRGLLKDPDPEVRLRAAQGLLAGRDTSGVPVLIDLLTDAAVEVRWQAEELLRWLAVDAAPEPVVGAGDPKAMAACQAAWRTWWTAQGQKADVPAAEREPRRPLLLLAYSRKDGRAWVVGCDGVTRHEWKGLERLADAQYVPGGTVLTLHEQPVRDKPLLAERDPAGKPLWHYDDLRDPRRCQRLSNGHVFVAERQDIELPYLWYQVVAAGGRKAATRPKKPSVPGWSDALRQTVESTVLCVIRSKDGHGQYGAGLFEYDPSKDAAVRLPFGTTSDSERSWVEDGWAGSYLLSGSHPPRPGVAGDIVECAADGYPLWAYHLPGTTFAARLRGGTTVASLTSRIVELTSDKRMISELVLDGPADIAHPILGLIRLGLDTQAVGVDLQDDVELRAARLGRGSKRDRLNTLVRLADAGPEAAGCIPQIEKYQDDPDPDIRTAVRKALDAAGRTRIPELLTDLKHTAAERRVAAARSLGDYSRDSRAVDALIAALGDPDAKVRFAAAAVLGRMEADPQNRTPYSARRGRLRGSAEKIVRSLIKVVGDNDTSLRTVAIQSLGMMGAGAKPAVPLLIRCLKDDDTSVRIWAARALGQIGAATPEVIPALYEALNDTTAPQVRGVAALALADIGRPAANSVGRLLDAYRASDTGLPEKVVELNRASIVAALGRLGPTDRRTVPFLIDLLKDPDISIRIRSQAAEAVAQIGPAAAGAISVLTALSQAHANDPAGATYERFARELRHRAADAHSAANAVPR
jgi:HEAT repeat protein